MENNTPEELIKEQSYLFGYFENECDEKPSYDPGLNVPCMVCGEKLTPPLKTISLKIMVGAKRSYFYRTHKKCYESLDDNEIMNYESSLIDNL